MLVSASVAAQQQSSTPRSNPMQWCNVRKMHKESVRYETRYERTETYLGSSSEAGRDEVRYHQEILTRLALIDKKISGFDQQLKKLVLQGGLSPKGLGAFSGYKPHAYLGKADEGDYTWIASSFAHHDESNSQDPTDTPNDGTQSQRSSVSLPLPPGDKFCIDPEVAVTLSIPETATWGSSRPEKANDDEADEKNSMNGSLLGSALGSEDRGTLMSSQQSQERGERKRRASVSSADAVVSSLADVQAKGNKRSKDLETLWNFLDDPDSSKAAKAYAVTMPYVIFCAVVLAILETPAPPPLEGQFAMIVNVVMECIFALEFILRLIACPSKKFFCLDYNNTIDFLAAVPLAFRVAIGGALVEDPECGYLCTTLMCFVPVVRAFKALRRFESLQLLLNAWQKAAEGLPVCIFFLFVATLLFASAIFIVEPRDNIESFPKAMWLTIVTMTTVGYGDVTPSSTIGSLIVSVLVVFSVLYMAMPLGIVGNAFTEVWQERDFILLRNKTRWKLSQWGYGPADLPTLFSIFDSDNDGELQHEDFQAMMIEMRIGLTRKRIDELFDLIDVDGSGKIDDEEFIKAVFPESYETVYESQRTNSKPHLSEVDEDFDPTSK